MTKTKLNVIIASAIGILTGFVFGLAFNSGATSATDSGKAHGNVSELSKLRHAGAPETAEAVLDAGVQRDTISMTATDKDGVVWNVTISKNK